VRVLPSAPTMRTAWPLFFAAALMVGFVALLVSSASKSDPAPIVHHPELPKPKPELPVPAPTRTPSRPPAPQPAPEKKDVDIPAPKPVIVRKPADPAPETAKPETRTEPPTTVAANDPKPVEARIEKLQGDVVDDAGAPAKIGALVSGLDVRGAKASAVVALLDNTKVELTPGTKLEKFLVSADQKRFVLARGTALATVSKQPAKMSVVFETPHAEVTVIGTKLTVDIAKESTKVEVQEGRVRLKRTPDGASTEIAAGRFAVAGKGPAPASKPIQVVRHFQDGPDYQGTRDTWISYRDQNANNATAVQLRIGKLDGAQTALISWDVSSIPVGSRIVSAELTWWVTGKLVGPVQVYHLRVPFDETQATWKTPGGALKWSVQGAQGDQDRSTSPIATLAPAKMGFSTIPVNSVGLDVLQEILNGKKGTFAILVAGPEQGNEWDLDSRESATADRRPKLTITYIPPTK
jgi:hypothetical protein